MAKGARGDEWETPRQNQAAIAREEGQDSHFAVHGFRSDAPVVQRSTGGRLPSELTDPDARRQALAQLEADVFSRSNLHVVEAKLRTITRILEFFGLAALPPSREVIWALGAGLKKGRYRTARSYLSQYKGLCNRAGFSLSDVELRAITDAARSCERGLGGPVRALGLPFQRLSELDGGWKPWFPSGPFGTRNFLIAGSWFLLRETEAAAAAISDIEVSSDGRSVRWHLPVSKTDQAARGVARTHLCSCPPNSFWCGCPVHAILDQVMALRRQFPAWFGPDGETLGRKPLFPSATGLGISKAAATEAIRRAATSLGVADCKDGSERVSGHSMRVTGAQGLAALGLDLWAIQLLGRWGSDTVQLYVREAGLQSAALSAANAFRDLALPALVEQILDSKRGPPVGEPSSSSAATVENLSSIPSPFAGQHQELAEPLQDAVAVAEAQAQPLPGTSPTPSPNEVVKNTRSGVWHRVALGPAQGAPTDAWLTVCCWRFGAGASAELGTVADLPKSWSSLCANCFVTLRAQLKADAAAALREHDGGDP